MTTSKQHAKEKTLPKKKVQIGSVAKEFYSGFAENVRECYIPRFVTTDKDSNGARQKTKNEKVGS